MPKRRVPMNWKKTVLQSGTFKAQDA
jgi:hypothetical protein